MVVVDIIPVDVGDVDVCVDISIIVVDVPDIVDVSVIDDVDVITDVVVIIVDEVAVVPGLELNVKFALNPLLANMPSVSKTIIRLLHEV